MSVFLDPAPHKKTQVVPMVPLQSRPKGVITLEKQAPPPTSRTKAEVAELFSQAPWSRLRNSYIGCLESTNPNFKACFTL